MPLVDRNLISRRSFKYKSHWNEQHLNELFDMNRLNVYLKRQQMHKFCVVIDFFSTALSSQTQFFLSIRLFDLFLLFVSWSGNSNEYTKFTVETTVVGIQRRCCEWKRKRRKKNKYDMTWYLTFFSHADKIPRSVRHFLFQIKYMIVKVHYSVCVCECVSLSISLCINSLINIDGRALILIALILIKCK